jgi:hypothetical protein
MAIISFEANIPVEVALKFASGLEKPGYKEGDSPRMFFTLCGDDAMYVPMIVADQIKKLGIKQFELIRIVKRTQGKVTRWLVERAGDTQTEAIEPPPPNFDDIPTAIDATPIERQLTTSINQAKLRKAPPAKVTPPASTSTSHPDSNPLIPNAAGHTRASAVMAAAMVAAIDALIIGEQYGKAKGKILQFNEEDVRCVAATIYIQACKDPLFHERVVTQKVNGGASWPQQ